MAFLNSPCHETPKNVIKKKSNKTTEGEKKKPEKKKAAFFVMSRDGLFRKKKSVFLNSPCCETPKKTPLKKSIKIKIKINKIK
jgi:hypothetical protein